MHRGARYREEFGPAVALRVFSASVMATDPPADLLLAPLNGEPRSVAAWVTTFHLGLVVLDPYTYESSWLLEEAGRILVGFSAADVRVGWLVTANEADTRTFLGPWAEQLLTFCDPDRAAVKALGLTSLPAFVHIDMGCHLVGSAEGWDPQAWRAAVGQMATTLSWSTPIIPGAGAPGPYPGTPALV